MNIHTLTDTLLQTMRLSVVVLLKGAMLGHLDTVQIRVCPLCGEH